MKRCIGGWIGLAAGLASGAWAQEPAAAAEAATEAARTSMTIMEVLQAGGPLMYVLGALSVGAVALIVYLAVVLRQEAVVPRELLHDLRDALGAGRLDEARAACRRSRTALAVVADTALVYQPRTAAAPELLKEFIEGEGGRQAAQLQNQAQYLLDLAVIAPMVGLLGTVTGMLQAFNAVALDLARARPMTLASGVAQALITTIAGLIIGIPAMAFYSYFRARVSKLTAVLEQASAEILALMIARR
jgi:biopolymer transport protein ExbB